LEFEVADTGIGIPESARDSLFDRFTQVDASTTRKFGGTGLGLAICHQICEMMGGDIGVRSEEGQGSVFHFTVRVSDIASENADSHADPRRDLLPLMVEKRALVVGPASVSRNILVRQLSGWGLQTDAAAGIYDANIFLKDANQSGNAFDLVFINQSLRDESGISLGTAIRREFGPDQPKLVFIAAEDSSHIGELVKGAGFDACVSQPLRLLPLMDRLSEIMTPATDISHEDDAYPCAPGPAAGQEGGLAKRIRILLAEDNVINQKVILAMLVHGDYQIDIANNGLEAVEAVRRSDYDLVLMDVHMPELDGIQATIQIRAMPGPKSKLPIIAVTADAMPGDREKFLQAGMNDYVTKPIDHEKFTQVVARHCGARSRIAEVVHDDPGATPGPAEDRDQSGNADSLADLPHRRPGSSGPHLQHGAALRFLADTPHRPAKRA
jgi:CheY-like chemotaxis protein